MWGGTHAWWVLQRGWRMRHGRHVEAEASLWVMSSHHVGPKVWTLIARLGGRCLYPLCHLTCAPAMLFLNKELPVCWSHNFGVSEMPWARMTTSSSHRTYNAYGRKPQELLISPYIPHDSVLITRGPCCILILTNKMETYRVPWESSTLND